MAADGTATIALKGLDDTVRMKGVMLAQSNTTPALGLSIDSIQMAHIAYLY